MTECAVNLIFSSQTRNKSQVDANKYDLENGPILDGCDSLEKWS